MALPDFKPNAQKEPLNVIGQCPHCSKKHKEQPHVIGVSGPCDLKSKLSFTMAGYQYKTTSYSYWSTPCTSISLVFYEDNAKGCANIISLTFVKPALCWTNIFVSFSADDEDERKKGKHVKMLLNFTRTKLDFAFFLSFKFAVILVRSTIICFNNLLTTWFMSINGHFRGAVFINISR